jgi:hypothetical protein
MFPTAEEASESKENSFRRHSFLRRVGNIWHGVREKAPRGARRDKKHPQGKCKKHPQGPGGKARRVYNQRAVSSGLVGCGSPRWWFLFGSRVSIPLDALGAPHSSGGREMTNSKR